MRSAAPAHSPIAAAAAAVVRFAAKLREANESRRMVRSLASLDDHMLRDIGLTRFDVNAVLAERARASRRNQQLLAREARAWAA